jgi:Protein of unknown function (DUF2892)
LIGLERRKAERLLRKRPDCRSDRLGRYLNPSQLFEEYDLMTRNVGGIDRIFRIVLGLGLIALVFVGPKTALGWIGIIPLVTALTGNCPAYSLFGFSTCPKSSR